LIVPFAVGGAVTFLTEQIVKEMEGELGQSIVRDYRGGAGGTIAMEAAAMAPHDGYTLFLLSTSQAISAGVYPDLKVDVVRDFEPVILLATSPYALVINPALPVGNVPELVAYGKSHPGKLFQGTSGTGGSDDIVGHEFARISGMPVVYVPFRGAGPAVPELLAGRVNLSFFSPLPTKAFVQQGKLRLLGITTRQRSPAMPDVPTIAEQGYPDFDFPGWYGLAVPRGTPDAVVATLQRAASNALGKAAVKDFLATNGLTAGGGPSADFKSFVARETARWSKLARGMGIQPG
jgi:tripartite-type tricarboxylate transporter receptor subunit TctC